jgi:DNA-binding NarL/FixJ family response regulator
VLVVEDEPLVAQTLCVSLREVAQPTVASTKHEALQLLRQGAWRGILLDVALPDGMGTDLLPQIKQHQPNAVVIVTTGAENASASHAAAHHRAIFLSKPLLSGWLRLFLAEMRGSRDESIVPDLARIGLSPAEIEVFSRLAEGLQAADVAASLSISVATVRTHSANVYRRLGVRSLAGVLRLAAGWATTA